VDRFADGEAVAQSLPATLEREARRGHDFAVIDCGLVGSSYCAGFVTRALKLLGDVPHEFYNEYRERQHAESIADISAGRSRTVWDHVRYLKVVWA
jgi:hypothetical protein